MRDKVPEQDSGMALVGRECWVWDGDGMTHCSTYVRTVSEYRSMARLPYTADGSSWEHARPIALGRFDPRHPDPNHPSHKKEPKMTELEQARKAFNDLDKAHKEMGDKLKALEEAEKQKRPKLSEGQVWAYKDGRLYVVVPNKFLVNMDTWCGWCGTQGFGGDEDDFTYIGLAKDILTVNLPKA